MRISSYEKTSKILSQNIARSPLILLKTVITKRFVKMDERRPNTFTGLTDTITQLEKEKLEMNEKYRGLQDRISSQAELIKSQSKVNESLIKSHSQTTNHLFEIIHHNEENVKRTLDENSKLKVENNKLNIENNTLKDQNNILEDKKNKLKDENTTLIVENGKLIYEKIENSRIQRKTQLEHERVMQELDAQFRAAGVTGVSEQLPDEATGETFNSAIRRMKRLYGQASENKMYVIVGVVVCIVGCALVVNYGPVVSSYLLTFGASDVQKCCVMFSTGVQFVRAIASLRSMTTKKALNCGSASCRCSCK